jgi:serine/threonine-protein kinase
MRVSLLREKPGKSIPASRSGRYAVESVLGSGSMGVVHRAFDSVLGRTVAIKTIRQELVVREALYRKYRTRFFREASIFGALVHPNVVTLYDVGENERGVPFLAMEYVAGGSVGELVARGKRLSLDRSMWILAQLAAAIDFAHAQGVIHRDIKPSNILLREGDEAKLTDFGVAKILGSEFTRSQTIFGTPGYMSPEQVVGSPVTRKSDLFSLGVVAFELFSGLKPFPGAHVESIFYKLVHADPIVPPDLESEGLITSMWREVFSRALAKEPGERYETASAFVSDLVELFPGSWLGHLTSGESLERAVSPERTNAPDTLTLWPDDGRE